MLNQCYILGNDDLQNDEGNNIVLYVHNKLSVNTNIMSKFTYTVLILYHLKCSMQIL